MNRNALFLVMPLLSSCAEQIGPEDSCGSVPELSSPWSDTSEGQVNSEAIDSTLRFSFRIPIGRPLKSLTAIVEPAAGHSSLPERLPWFSLFDEGGGAFDTIGTAFDSSKIVRDYDKRHGITLDLSMFSWSAQEGHSQTGRFVSEGGAGALPGFTLREWHCGI